MARRMAMRSRCFNPRSRTGSDDRGVQAAAIGDGVSIHAPARGATTRSSSMPLLLSSFNPRSRTGSDCFAWWARPYSLLGFNPRSRTGSDVSSPNPATSGLMFQSTLPHGERPQPHRLRRIGMRRFNPRSRTGSDRPASTHFSPSPMFQSTLPHGERPDCLRLSRRPVVVSIHAPARGATCGR